MGHYIYRLEGAALLDGAMYESIESDRAGTRQAALTVLLSSVAAGIGASAQLGWHPVLIAATGAVAVITWVAWAVVMFQVGTRLLPGPDTRTDLRELLRTTGFAAAPGMLQAMAAVLPAAATPIFAVTMGWMLVAMVIAIKHALDYQSVWRAVAVVAIGAIICAGLAVLIAIAIPSVVS